MSDAVEKKQLADLISRALAYADEKDAKRGGPGEGTAMLREHVALIEKQAAELELYRRIPLRWTVEMSTGPREACVYCYSLTDGAHTSSDCPVGQLERLRGASQSGLNRD